MAAWTDFSNGEGGLSIRNKINTALGYLLNASPNVVTEHKHNANDIVYDNSTSGLSSTEVKSAIDEVDGRLDTLEADVVNADEVVYDPTGTVLSSTDVQAAINEIANLGISHMVANSPITGISVTTTPAKLNWADTVHHQIGTAVVGNATTDRFTFGTDGTYKVYGTIQLEGPNGAEVSMYLYKNGLELTPPVTVTTQGAGKTVTTVYTTLLDFVDTDYIEIYVSADSSITIDIEGSSVIVERTPY